MVVGTMKWLSVTKQFGFVAPDDGSRDVFVRLSSGTRSASTSGANTTGGLGGDAPAGGRGKEPGLLPLATKVEVRTRYQAGHWAPGYEVAEVLRAGYHVRRPGSRREMLPEAFAAADVRQAGER